MQPSRCVDVDEQTQLQIALSLSQEEQPQVRAVNPNPAADHSEPLVQVLPTRLPCQAAFPSTSILTDLTGPLLFLH